MPNGGEQLTDREAEILELIAEHYTDRQIHERLFISIDTVHFHVRNVLRKLAVHSRGTRCGSGSNDVAGRMISRKPP